MHIRTFTVAEEECLRWLCERMSALWVTYIWMYYCNVSIQFITETVPHNCLPSFSTKQNSLLQDSVYATVTHRTLICLGDRYGPYVVCSLTWTHWLTGICNLLGFFFKMKPTRCTLLLSVFISTYLHVLGNYVPIIRPQPPIQRKQIPLSHRYS